MYFQPQSRLGSEMELYIRTPEVKVLLLTKFFIIWLNAKLVIKVYFIGSTAYSNIKYIIRFLRSNIEIEVTPEGY